MYLKERLRSSRPIILLPTFVVFLVASSANATTSPQRSSADVLTENPYLVIYPNALIPGVPLDIRVTVLNATSSVTQKVEFETRPLDPHLWSVTVLAELWDIHRTIIASQTQAMSAGDTSHFSLEIPMGLHNLGPSGYAVRVSGSGGLTFDTSGFITLEGRKLAIITQTDKTRYAGGQDVKFRSVLLLPNLLGYKGNATVTAYDGDSNKIQVFGPQLTDKGVIEGMLTLSQEPVFGTWKLVTEAQGFTSTKSFTVKPYELPKFSVFITTLGQNDTDIEVKVSARYTFNNDVHGSCALELYSGSTSSDRLQISTQEILGSVVFHVQMFEVTRKFGLDHPSIGVRAMVTDSASSITMVAEKDNFIAEHQSHQSYIQRTHLKRFDNRLTFIPGMNFYTVLSLEKEGETVHTPTKIAIDVRITTTEVRMCMLAHPAYPWLEQITTRLPEFYVDTDSSGLAPLNIPIPPNAEMLQIKTTSEVSTSSDTFYVYPLVLENTPMLRVVPSTPHVQVGEMIVLSVNATEEMTGKLVIEVYARGIAVRVSSMDVSSTRFSSVAVAATHDMVPYTHITVTHITANNSLMYDYALVKVIGSPTENQVRVGFNATSLKPGQDIEIRISADPNSTVYVLTEDLKNRLLGTDNDIFLLAEKVGFNTTSLKPGQGVEMRISADPNSTVYVLTEDLKNRLLGTDNDIFLYQLDEVISESGYDASVSGSDRQTKRSAGPAPLVTKYETTGYTFMDDGIIVLPENNNVLNRVTCEDRHNSKKHYPRQLNSHNSTASATESPGVSTCAVCVYKGRHYKQGERWEDGCDYRCTCEDARTGFYRCVEKCAKYSNLPIFCDLYPDPANPMCCKVALCDFAAHFVTHHGLQTTPMPLGGVPQVRSHFPETWLWEKFQVGPSGNVSIPLTVPDSITSWVTSVFATNENTGFGLETTKPKITVKRDFFVTMDPPKLIVLGEEFLLQLTVFNYLDTIQRVHVQVNTTDDPSNVMENTFNVNPDEGHSTFFQITPKRTGSLSITAVARAGLVPTVAVDEIMKEVMVKPNGVHKRSNEQHLVEVSASAFNHTILLTDPPNMVPGSKSIKMTITGDLMTNSIEGLDQLISMPYGCGEQNMLNFAPDIYVTKYLKTVGKLTEKIKKRAMSYMTAGLQKELTYKHHDGSFSAFGDRDNSGSSWLTAFVLKCFQQAEGILDIDEGIKATGVNWLLKYQNPDGAFYEPGRIIHTGMQAGTGSGLKLTAFILISILENADYAKSPALTSSVAKATTYLSSNLDNVPDVYTLAIVCHALAKSGETGCFGRVESLAVHDGNKMYWKSDTQLNGQGHTSMRAASAGKSLTRASSADIEATSHCLLTYLEVGERVKAKPIVNWLVAQRNPSGGFKSTQDTIVSLQALSEYAVQSQALTQVDLSAQGGVFSHAYSVTKANADLLHTVEVPASLPDLLISANGQGNAVVDVTMSYYVEGIENNTQIVVGANITKESLNSISVAICVGWNGAEPSGMIVAEVETPTGFMYDAEALNKGFYHVVKKHEMLGRNVAVYFDGIGAGKGVCAVVKMDRIDPVVKSQACHVTVYDYYEPSNQARTRYESGVLKSSTICDVCPECSFCKPGGGVGQVLMDSLHLLEHQLLDSLIWLDDNSDVLVSAAKVLKNACSTRSRAAFNK